MELGLQGKRVLISGGSSGIGLAAARQFLEEGAKVCIMGRTQMRGEAAVASLQRDFPAAAVFFAAGDVRRREDGISCVRQMMDRWGGMDVLVNSAGIYQEGALDDLTPAELDDILATNVKGTFYLTQASLTALRSTRGAVVNVASDAGVHGNYFCAAYCASKGAMVLFTRALALELASFGVRVNAIAPGDIMTPLTQAQLQGAPDPQQALREMASVYPLGRIGTPEEAASLIVFLASARAGFITGAIYGVDGGLTA